MWAVADVTPCELGPPFWIDDQRFSPHSSLDFQLFISIAQNPAGDSPLTIRFFILVILLPLPLHIPSLPTFHLFSQFLKLFRLPPCLVPSHSLYVSFYLHFFNAHFLFLSLYLSFCLPLWEFKKYSVSLMKEKCCFTPPTLFCFEIKGNVKYPPGIHTHWHS